MKIYVLIIAILSSCQLAHIIDHHIIPKKINHNLTLLSVDNDEKLLSSFYDDYKALIIFFWQSKCPCVKRYENRINNLYKKYRDLGVNFIYVSSNNNESFAMAINEYHHRKSLLPLFRDHNGVLASILKAKSTPSAAIINNHGDMVFLGWIDNEREEKDKHRIPYLENALKELLLDVDISIKTSPMFGCPIL